MLATLFRGLALLAASSSMSRRVLHNPATAFGRQSEAQLEERRATAIATAASESIELLRSTSTASGFRNVAIDRRKGTKRFKAVIKPSAKAAGVAYSGKEPNFYTAEEASLFANRTYKLLGMDLQRGWVQARSVLEMSP